MLGAQVEANAANEAAAAAAATTSTEPNAATTTNTVTLEQCMDDAISYLSKAIEQDPRNYDCLIGLAKAYEKKGELEKAVQCAELAIDTPEPNINAIFYLGMLLLKKKDIKQAGDTFKRVLSNSLLFSFLC